MLLWVCTVQWNETSWVVNLENGRERRIRVFDRRKTLGQDWNVREKQWAQIMTPQGNATAHAARAFYGGARGLAWSLAGLPRLLCAQPRCSVIQSPHRRWVKLAAWDIFTNSSSGPESSLSLSAVNTASVSTVVKLKKTRRVWARGFRVN